MVSPEPHAIPAHEASMHPQSTEARLRAEIETLQELVAFNQEFAAAQAELAERSRIDALSIIHSREEQRRLTHDIIAAAADPLFVLDADYRITFTNRQAVEAIHDGFPLIGRTLPDVFPGLTQTTFWAHFNGVMQDRISISFEEFYPPSKLWYQVTASPVGKGIACFFRDITERRRHDELMQRSEKLAAVGRLASSISHEINNPLESVTNLLYLIEHSNSLADIRPYAQLAATELSRVSHIVTQTLKFHRQSTQAVSTRASELIENVLALFHGRIVTLGATVHSDFAPDDDMLCFSGDMRQVMANLIGNALDAVTHGGQLWLRTRRALDPRTGDPGVRVLVADNGSGMTPETQRRVFEAFFTTKPATGTGLGLWVSHEIVRNHNGNIAFRSSQTPGRTGTAFSVFVPH